MWVFSSNQGFFFSLLNSIFWRAEILISMRSNYYFLLLVFFMSFSMKVLPKQKNHKSIFLFSSRRFIVLVIAFMSVIHFFIYGRRCETWAEFWRTKRVLFKTDLLIYFLYKIIRVVTPCALKSYCPIGGIWNSLTKLY